MLQAVLADFQSWGQVRTLATLDARLCGLSLPADLVVVLHPEVHSRSLADLAAKCNAALIIAPESDGVLARLSALVERAGADLLGASPEAISVAADKWECYQRFVKAGLPTPDTWRVRHADAVAAAEKMGWPLVVKPVDGVGCEGVGLATDADSLHLALEHPALKGGDILLQRYIVGTHASVSLLVAARGTLALSLNEQWIHIGVPFAYRGGVVPLAHPLRERALELAQQAVSLIPGLRGYVGVDLVLDDEVCYLIEVNPRLTTSYVGLRQVINVNLAQAIWQACRQNVLPSPAIVSGKASFHKEELGGIP